MGHMPKLTPEAQQQVADRLREAAVEARANGDDLLAARQEDWSAFWRARANGTPIISPDHDIERVVGYALWAIRGHALRLHDAERNLGRSRELDEGAMAVNPLDGLHVAACEPAVVKLIENLLVADEDAMRIAAVAATRGLSVRAKEQLRPAMMRLGSDGGERLQAAAKMFLHASTEV